MLAQQAKEKIVEMYLELQQERELYKDNYIKVKRTDKQLEELLGKALKIVSGVFTIILNWRTLVALIREAIEIIKKR